MIVRGSGPPRLGRPGPAVPRRAVRAVHRAGRARAHRAGRGGARSRPSELAFFPLWSYAHPQAIELAERLAALRPGRPQPGLLHHRRRRGRRDRLEAGQAVLQADRQADQVQGDQPVGRLPRHHAWARCRSPACPTLQGAVRAAGAGRAQGAEHELVPRARAPGDDPKAFGRWAADQIGEAIECEGPDTVAAVFLEPVQNAGGCFPPPPGYFERVREICDQYDVLLVSDEVICAFGRIGSIFACDDFGYVPDMITCAKGMTSGYSPIGALIVSDRLVRAVRARATRRSRTATRSAATRCPPRSRSRTSTSSSARASPRTSRRTHRRFRRTLEELLDLPIVGDVRGDGYFYGIELVKDKATRETFDDDESERLLRGFLSGALFDAGPVLPGRRPRRPGRPARPAADLRAGRVRRDQAASCAAC